MPNVFDFGKNTHQTQVSFKFECISPLEVRSLVRDLLGAKAFETVDRDQSTKQTVLYLGDGSEKTPGHQLRLGPDSISIWVGWHIAFGRWQEFRGTTIKHLMPLLKLIPVDAVRSFRSESGTLVPIERMKGPAEVPELTPFRAVVSRFVPSKLLARGSGYSIAGDVEGTQSVEWFLGPSNDPGAGSANFISTHFSAKDRQGVFESWLAHLKESDELLQGFHTHLLSLLIRA